MVLSVLTIELCFEPNKMCRLYPTLLLFLLFGVGCLLPHLSALEVSSKDDPNADDEHNGESDPLSMLSRTRWSLGWDLVCTSINDGKIRYTTPDLDFGDFNLDQKGEIITKLDCRSTWWKGEFTW